MNYYSSFITSKSQAYSEISNIFYQQSTDLRNTRYQKSQELDDWANGLVRQIREHLTKQKSLLEVEYDQQKLHLDQKREGFLRTLSVYEQNQTFSKIDQLLQECRSFKLQLSTIEYPEHNLPFFELVSSRKTTETKQDERNACPTADTVSGNRSPRSNNNDMVNYSGVTTLSVHNISSNQTPGASNPGGIDTSFNASYDNRYRDANANDTPVEKCPACFMIFPAYMSTAERQEHVNEHYRGP